jgi:hypothetical protein
MQLYEAFRKRAKVYTKNFVNKFRMDFFWLSGGKSWDGKRTGKMVFSGGKDFLRAKG